MGGYKFLMRYYSVEDDLYFFGFSRGAYTARFLAEMLDHIGLLSAGNEELIRFAWKTYAKWASRKNNGTDDDKEKEKELYEFMRGFRETFSRPVRRIRFLGLFDTVNSVPKFESAWMQRSKFPYTARSSAKVIRHAVSIDERRAKFRQDLISGNRDKKEDQKETLKIHRYDSDLERMAAHQKRNAKKDVDRMQPQIEVTNEDDHTSRDASEKKETLGDPGEKQQFLGVPNGLPTKKSSNDSLAAPISLSTEDLRAGLDTKSDNANSGKKQKPGKHEFEQNTHQDQDIEEVWFAGGHADIGGGWSKTTSEQWMLSHAPLVWMVHEAGQAGLDFDIRYITSQLLHTRTC